MTDTTPPDRTLIQLEVQHGLKRLLGRDPLRINTPFSEEQIVCYGTNVAALDVPEIHGEQRQVIEAAISHTQTGQQSRVLLLAGNPGMGKSHLLNWFRRPEIAHRLGYLLLCPTNHWNVNEFEGLLLDNLLAAMCKTDGDGKQPLLERVEAIAFTALHQLLNQPGSLKAFRPRNSGWLRRWLGLVPRPNHGRLSRLLEKRDATAFRLIDFRVFVDYVRDRFLADSPNPLHRYVLGVLLCYLFAEERELVLHWFRGRSTQGHFTKKFGVEEELDGAYKRMDAVRLLMSLFSAEVSRGLGEGDLAPAPRVFLLAFDQIEGRDELFDKEDDWFTFFAHLSELFNSLPNVVILFTMTLGLRDRLHCKLEQQFRDRIRRDDRLVLREPRDQDVLALYRRRVDSWLGQNEQELRSRLSASGNPYLPLEEKEVIDLAAGRPVRRFLEQCDEQFRERLLKLTVDPPYDYLLWRRELNPLLDENANSATESHLKTVDHLLTSLGEALARSYGVGLHPPQWTRTSDELPVLELRFVNPADESEWVRIYLARLPHNYTGRLDACARLLAYRAADSNFLWLVRHNPIDESWITSKSEQTTCNLLTLECELSYRALIQVAAQRENYSSEVWEQGEPALVEVMRKTYLGDLFARARTALFASAEEVAPSPQGESA